MELTEERAALRDAVRGLLGRHTGVVSTAGYDTRLWSRLCGEIGVAGLAVPPAYGGAGASLLEAHLVLEELGRGLTPSPMLGSAVLAAQALLLCGDAGACERLSPAIADGSRLATVAWTGPAGDWDGTAVAAAATAPGRLTGEAHYVLDADLADVLLVLARDGDGIGLYEVAPADVTRTLSTTMDTTRRLGVVGLRDAPAQRLGERFPMERLRDIACVALSAEQLGAASAALDITVAYTKTRVQFGRPIGAFQAVQHRLAGLHVFVESAASASYAAAEAVHAGAPDAALLAAVAKVHCSETLQRVAGEMIQLHGALGITWEHDAHRYFKRAHGAAQLFGAPHRHVARIAAAVLNH